MKIAACFADKGVSCDAIARKMVAAQTHCAFHRDYMESVPGGYVGCVSTSDQFSDIPLYRKSENRNWLMVSGCPIDLNLDLEQRLASVLTMDYHAAGRSLSELDGAFTACFWDDANRKFVVVTDFLGMQPLYMYRRDDILLIASEAKGIAASEYFDVKMDPAGWGCFISLGHLIAGRTMVQDVVRVEPGSIIVWDPVARDYECSTYWHWPCLDPNITIENIDTAELIDALRRNILAYGEHVRPGTILMSGGFDSRLILALLSELEFSPKALVVKHGDELWGADNRFALQATQQYGITTELVSAPKDFYSTPDYLEYLMLNEVMTPSLYLFIAQVTSFLKTKQDAVWEGMVPAYIFRLSHHHTRGGFREYLSSENALPTSRGWKAARLIFGESAADQMYDAFRALFNEECGKYSNDENGIFEFLVKNRMRNRTGPNPLKVYENYALPYTPGLTKYLWNITGKIPCKVKAGYQLYYRTLHEHFPKAAGIPVVSGTTVYPGTSWWGGGRVTHIWSLIENRKTMRAAQKLLSKCTRGSWNYWDDSRYPSLVLDQVDTHHHELNGEGLRRLKESPPGLYHGTNYLAKHLLFYWQVWQWTTQGKHYMEWPIYITE